MEEEAPSRRSVSELAGRFKSSAPPHDAAENETEEAPSRRSVSELAGRFKSSAPPHDAAENETKPVRRRPPRSLQLPKTHGDDQEQPPGVTSLPTKAKRNSALIEKLQANLPLSPVALLPSPKSPGFRLLHPAFSPSPVSSTTTPTSPVATSPLTEDEGPASFEAPPTASEGSILSNINKGRARHSIRRRPPSRRHRKSSGGDEVAVTNEGGDISLSSPTEPEDKTTEGGEKEGGGEVFEEEGKIDEVKEDKTDTSMCPEENKSNGEDQSKISIKPRKEDEKKEEEENGSMGGEEGDGSSPERKEEEAQEKNSGEKHEDSTEAATNTDSKEEEKSEETTTSAR